MNLKLRPTLKLTAILWTFSVGVTTLWQFPRPGFSVRGMAMAALIMLPITFAVCFQFNHRLRDIIPE